jgi:integrase
VRNNPATALLSNLPRQVGTEHIFPGARGGVFGKPQNDFHRIRHLRHTFASQAIHHGATLYEVRHLFGHLCSTTTQRHSHLADDRLRAVRSFFRQKRLPHIRKQRSFT